MTFLPIVNRELRVAARRWRTYWSRAGAALVLIIGGTWLFVMLRDQPPQSVARGLFSMLTGAAFVVALFSGVGTTADCLSSEKREGTLGLLFLTDLKGYDVVLGKLAVTSLKAFYCMVAVMPLLAIPLLLGGITFGEFGRTALVSVNTLFFSLGVGMCVSALSRTAQKAMGVTFLIILGFVAGLPGCGLALASFGARPMHLGFLLPSAGFTYYLAFESFYRGAVAQFWGSLALIHGLGWLFLLLGGLIAPRVWQDRPPGIKGLRWRDRWRNWTYGTFEQRTAFRQQCLGTNAVFWLATRSRLKPATVWLFLGFVACVWLWGIGKFRRDWLNVGTYLATAALVNLVLRSWFAEEASRLLAEQRKAGTLELLLSTPLTVSDIVRGHFLALQRQFLFPILAVLAVECGFMRASLNDQILPENRFVWSTVWLAGMVMFVADLVALFWLGLWQGLTASNPARAASGASYRILFLPWALYALVMLFIALLSAPGPRAPGPGPDWRFFLGLWFVLGLLVDVGYGTWARNKVLLEFRRAAQPRQGTGGSFWQELIGRGQKHNL